MFNLIISKSKSFLNRVNPRGGFELYKAEGDLVSVLESLGFEKGFVRLDPNNKGSKLIFTNRYHLMDKDGFHTVHLRSNGEWDYDLFAES